MTRPKILKWSAASSEAYSSGLLFLLRGVAISNAPEHPVNEGHALFAKFTRPIVSERAKKIDKGQPAHFDNLRVVKVLTPGTLRIYCSSFVKKEELVSSTLFENSSSEILLAYSNSLYFRIRGEYVAFFIKDECIAIANFSTILI